MVLKASVCSPQSFIHRLGADIVVHSLTKYANGHSTAIGGAILGPWGFVMGDCFGWYKDLGSTPSPFDCWNTLQNMQDLPLRVARQSENAYKVNACCFPEPRTCVYTYKRKAASVFGMAVFRIVSCFCCVWSGSWLRMLRYAVFWLLVANTRLSQRGVNHIPQLARALEAHSCVSHVWYPGLTSHEQHGLAKQQVFSFLSVDFRDVSLRVFLPDNDDVIPVCSLRCATVCTEMIRVHRYAHSHSRVGCECALSPAISAAASRQRRPLLRL